MPADLFEDSLELQIATVEAQPIRVGERNPAYPHPTLRLTGAVETRSFRVAILENPYLRVTVAPDVGGRILEIIDKRASVAIVPQPQRLSPIPGGARGLRMPCGVQFHLTGQERWNAMGPVSLLGDPPEEEQDEAAVWIGSASHDALGWNARVALPAERAAILIELRVANRTLEPTPYDAGLMLPFPGFDGLAAYDPTGDVGLGVVAFEPLRMAATDEGVLVSRFASLGRLAGRQADSFSLELVPFSGLGGPPSIGAAGALAVNGDAVKIQSTRRVPRGLVVLRTPEGQDLEAVVDLYPEHTLSLPLAGQEVARAALLLDGETAIQWPSPEPPPPELPPALSGDAPLSKLDVARRHLAYLSEAHRLVGEGDLERAEHALEQVTLYNADDPLLWWAKAAVRRARGGDPSQELANAHYLAPTEPLLRAEALLGQPPAEGSAPNPLLAPLGGEELLEVACRYIELGLLQDAYRFLGEALRHRSLAMLHYLAAAILVRGTRMEAEAANHLRLASSAQLPPYPWRNVEVEALETVAARFPSDRPAASLLELARSFRAAMSREP